MPEPPARVRMILLLRAMKKAIWSGGFPPGTPMERRFALAQEARYDGVELVADEQLIDADAELRRLAERSASRR